MRHFYEIDYVTWTGNTVTQYHMIQVFYISISPISVAPEIKNARVFPLPVLAQPIQSSPANIRGIQFC